MNGAKRLFQARNRVRAFDNSAVTVVIRDDAAIAGSSGLYGGEEREGREQDDENPTHMSPRVATRNSDRGVSLAS